MAALPQFNQLVIPPNLTALEVVNLLWRARSPLVKSGLRSSMGFDLRIKARIGSKGVAELKNRYEYACLHGSDKATLTLVTTDL